MRGACTHVSVSNTFAALANQSVEEDIHVVHRRAILQIDQSIAALRDLDLDQHGQDLARDCQCSFSPVAMAHGRLRSLGGECWLLPCAKRSASAEAKCSTDG